MARTVRIDTVYPYEPAAVWSAISTSEALAEWLMPNTFQPIPGHVFELRAAPAPGFDGIVKCRVIEIVPPTRLSFTWVGGGLDTLVSFDLSPAEGGTRLRLTHSGFAGVKGRILGAMLGSGWRGMILRKLPRVLAGTTRAQDRASCGGESGFWRWFNKLTGRKPTA